MTAVPDGVILARETDLDPDSFIDILERSGLAARRPVADRARIETMVANADLIVTARLGGRLVGIARSITDFAFCCYLSELAVDRACHGRGIGRALIERTRIEAGEGVLCLLLSAPGAVGFYEAASLERHPDCFLFARRS